VPVEKPVSCCFCGAQGSAVTCGECSGQTYLDGVVSVVSYANVVVRQLISHWKYYGDRSVEPILERFLARMSSRIEPPLAPYVVTWVPLHVWRVRERGFDQGEEVAQMTGRLWGLPVERLLARVRSTESQAQSSKRAEVGELDGVFRLCRGVDVPTDVLLCDDVLTGGATMDACARVLKDAGVKRVWGMVVAQGG